MEILISSIFYLLIISSIIVIILKNIDYYRIIIFSLFLRTIAIFTNISLIPLPDSRSDAANFENFAWFWASSGIGNVINEIINSGQGNSWTYAKFISFVYVLLGRDYIFILIFNVLITALIMHFLIKISKELNFSKLSSQILLISFSIFPSLINYAAVSLREIFIYLLITTIIYYLIKWLKKFELKYFFLLCFLFYLNNFNFSNTNINIFKKIFSTNKFKKYFLIYFINISNICFL